MVEDSASWGGGPSTEGGCFIATAAYGSELAPPVQFLRDFRDTVVLKSKFRTIFERILSVYYKFSPPVAGLMRRNRSFKYAMKYGVVWPFVAMALTASFLIKTLVRKKQR